VLQYVAVRGSVLQCVVVCCRVVRCSRATEMVTHCSTLQDANILDLVSVLLSVCLRWCVFECACACVRVFVCVQMCTYIYMCVCACVCMFVRVCACACVSIYADSHAKTAYWFVSVAVCCSVCNVWFYAPSCWWPTFSSIRQCVLKSLLVYACTVL